MANNNLREIILDILLAIFRDGVYSHTAIHSALDKVQYFSKRDRAFITKVCEGTVERLIELDYIIDKYSTVPVSRMKPVIQNILRSATYQIRYMDSVPDASAVNEAVRLAQARGFYNLKGFVNGVLRSIARGSESMELPDREVDPIRYLSVCYSGQNDILRIAASMLAINCLLKNKHKAFIAWPLLAISIKPFFLLPFLAALMITEKNILRLFVKTVIASSGLLVPSSMYNISQVSINEAFSPLLGLELTLHNNLTTKLEYRQTRVVTLSMTSVQINEALSKDLVIGAGYKINNFNLFGSGIKHRKAKGRKNGNNDDNEQQNTTKNTTSNKRTGINHDLNLRLDVSYRKQAAIIRDIASMESTASSGNTAFKLSFTADYTLSKLITMSFYYDMQTNTPLLTSSTYPTTTHDFGLNIKLSLTR